MLAFLRRRSPLLLRLLVLAVVAFGSAGGMLVSALGELHAAGHADHAAAHALPAADAGDDDDGEARLLHLLAHCGHCHGHGGALAFAEPVWEVVMPPAVATSTPCDTRWCPAPLESLLRPPISA
ncbi:conserved exported hypothetical protein [uncultured Stenotrophomonas sp.]|uniref:DUF2946 domain-containing protein n=1 Tax=uncultured Stenotrophomonas sp. TaxID=165438 RepID=A0A1Y5Q4N9_9GAMM|nr:conserved exported hypothetical protein [uncultured Stenotrophomonas sp.]